MCLLNRSCSCSDQLVRLPRASCTGSRATPYFARYALIRDSMASAAPAGEVKDDGDVCSCSDPGRSCAPVADVVGSGGGGTDVSDDSGAGGDDGSDADCTDDSSDGGGVGESEDDSGGGGSGGGDGDDGSDDGGDNGSADDVGCEPGNVSSPATPAVVIPGDGSSAGELSLGCVC